MSSKAITSVSGRGVPVSGDDIDTDRIIPARFMKCVTFDGLGEYAFYDVRKHEDGTDKSHSLNEERYAGANILLTGNNFGCGSSREHAPQALKRAGFDAVIAEGFAEIFFGNSTQLSLICATLPGPVLARLMEQVEAEPTLKITVDVEREVIVAGSETLAAGFRAGQRDSLLSGRWDPLDELLAASTAVDTVAASLPYIQSK